MKFDLIKSGFNQLKKANDHVKEIQTINFHNADVNCRLRVKLHDVNQQDIIFSTFDVISWIVKFNFLKLVLNHLQSCFTSTNVCTPLEH